MQSKVEQACQDLLKALYTKSILDNPNFKDTPKRMARAFAEILDARNVYKFEKQGNLGKVDFPTPYNGIILSPKHHTFSMCPHHMLPVEYEITIGYMPSEKDKTIAVAGASKLARLADLLAHRAVLQETLTHDILSTIEDVLHPKGVCVIIKGVHMCMRCRGVKTNAPYITDLMSGVFVENSVVRSELMFLMEIHNDARI